MPPGVFNEYAQMRTWAADVWNILHNWQTLLKARIFEDFERDALEDLKA